MPARSRVRGARLLGAAPVGGSHGRTAAWARPARAARLTTLRSVVAQPDQSRLVWYDIAMYG